MKLMRSLFAILLLVAWPVLANETSPLANTPVYSLDQFGPLNTPAQADAAIEKAAAEIIAKGGGVMVIPQSAPAGWQPRNVSQGVWRKPEPPAPATDWGATHGVTILDYRDGTVKVIVPQVTGMKFERVFSLPDGQSAPHWDYFPMMRIENSVVNGSTSYRDWLIEDVKAGKDRRFYVRTIRGIFPGMFLNTGDHGGVQRLYVKSVGYDKERNQPYFVADIDIDLPAEGSILHNKNHINALHLTTYAHNENQTFDVLNWRHHYSQGDTYLFDGRFYYMGDVHSAAGDENGVIYAAFTESEIDHFRGAVESFDAATHELKYHGAAFAHTLGTGRPLINLNPQKWITGGTVTIVRPATWWDLDAKHRDDPVFAGRAYPSHLVTNKSTGIPELRMGGLIRFSKDAPVSPAAVGRYFAVDEPSEYVPGGHTVRRWYLIDRVTENPDGTKDIEIIRHWWGAKAAGAPTLYNPENYSFDGHVKPLKYIIAPGANVYDVSRGVKSGHQHSGGALDRLVKLSPGPDSGSTFDFAAGDAIEQAIGPDPFKPIPLRAWAFDKVPGAFPAPMLDLANHGPVQRYSAMTVIGGGGNLAEAAQRADKLPPWENYLVFNSAANNGIVFSADTGNAAILFRQPNHRAQTIQWKYADGTKEATLSVSPEDGTMKFDGAGISAPGGFVNVGGVSGSAVKANNLRGISLHVPAGAREFEVKLPQAESDDQYAVFVETNWLTAKSVRHQTATSFIVSFDTPPAAGAKLHWLLVR